MITSTTDLTQIVNSPAEITSAAVKLRQAVMDLELSPNEVMTVFDSWAKSLDARELNDIPGIVFLRMWLRRGTLEPIIARELGAGGLQRRVERIWSRRVQGLSLGCGGALARRQCRDSAPSLHDLRSFGGQCRLGACSQGILWVSQDA